MVAAVQPFISGAISKTVNLPNEATVDDMEQAYLEAWRSGAKSVSVYRDGSKRTQPLNTGLAGGAGFRAATAGPPQAARRARSGHPQVRHRRLQGLHHRRDVRRRRPRRDVPRHVQGGLDDLRVRRLLRPGDLLQRCSTACRCRTLVDKFSHTRFEPAGLTKNPNVRIAKSIVDYVFRWMATKFLSPDAQLRAGVNQPRESPRAPNAQPSRPRRPGRQPPSRRMRRRPRPRRRTTTRTRRRAWSAAQS